MTFEEESSKVFVSLNIDEVNSNDSDNLSVEKLISERVLFKFDVDKQC